MQFFLIISRQCFFRAQKVIIGGVNKFLEELNSSFGPGVLMCNFDSGEFRMFLKMIMSSYFRWVAEYWFVSTPGLEPFFSSKTHVALEIKSFQINMDVNVTKFTCTVWHMLLYFTRTYYFSFGFDRVTCRAVMIQDRSNSHCQIVFFFL